VSTPPDRPDPEAAVATDAGADGPADAGATGGPASAPAHPDLAAAPADRDPAPAGRGPAGPDEVAAAMRLGLRTGARHLRDAMLLMVRAVPAAATAKLLLALLAGVSPLLIAWLMKLIVDRLAATPDAGRAVGPLLALAAVLGGVGVVMAAQPHLSSFVDGVSERAVRRVVTGRLFAAVSSFNGLARLESPRFQDRLQIALSAGQMGPDRCVTTVLRMTQATVMLLGFVVTLFVIAPAMVVVVALAVLPAAWVELRLSRRRAAMTWRIGHAERREFFYSRLLSSLEAAKEVRLFRLGGFFGDRLLRELNLVNREQRTMDRRELIGQTSLALLSAVIGAGGLVWAVVMAVNGRLSVGDVTLFVAAVAGVQGALGALVFQAALAHGSLLLFDHYQAVVNAPPDLPVSARPVACRPLRVGIELRDVWFRYADGQPWALRGVDLTIPAGRAVGLVGLNGAGKSTLVKLLCRFYDPVRGQVLWDGTDLREFDVAQLRDRLSAVFQDFMGYDLTAAENIGVGDVNRLDDAAAIAAAAQLAGCAATIAALPNGYRTMLSRIFFDNADQDDPETGVLLSGGQWQRVAVARALLRDQRDLLILDEPSAGLDAEAEYEVHTRLRELRRGRTSLLISHRLSTVRDADVIAVLDAGRIVEQGSHDALVSHGGHYARLFGLQARGYAATTSGVGPVAAAPG
jgi:ATP-binding cassette subfamily B protein